MMAALRTGLQLPTHAATEQVLLAVDANSPFVTLDGLYFTVGCQSHGHGGACNSLDP